MVLSSPELQVTVVPAWGGKTTSIRERSKGEELLFVRPGEPPASRTDFGDWAFGWDDCWPSVSDGGAGYPDHGALWRLDPVVESVGLSRLVLRTDDPQGRWSYRKTWTVAESLSVDIEIRNTGGEPLEGFWTLHALVRLEDDQRLVFPGEDRRRTVHGPDFGPASLPPPGSASKFWLPEAVNRGLCGVDYPGLGLGFRLGWNPQTLPYLGLWITRGGFRGESNLAWEPSDGYYDSVETARQNGALPVLEPGQTRQLSFQLRWGPLPSASLPGPDPVGTSP